MAACAWRIANFLSILEFAMHSVEGQMFSWKRDEPEERLDSLKPFHHFTAARRM